MGLIKRSNGHYQARIRGADGKIICLTLPTKKQAMDVLTKWKQEKKDLILGTSHQRQITVDEFFHEWFSVVNSEKSVSGWRKGQKQYFRDYISPAIGHVQLRAVKPYMVQSLFTRMADLGKSPQTQCLVYATLRKMFSDAIQNYQYLPFNPVLSSLKPAAPQKEAPHLNYDETKKLLQHVKDKPYGLCIWTQLYIGLRYSELRGLKFSDMDLKEGRVTIRRTYVMKTNSFREYPKGRKQHTHSIPLELLLMLREHKSGATSEFVFTNKVGGIMPYRWYLKLLKKYCRELGVQEIGTHGIRHSTSELYIRHGATKDDLQRLFAHSDQRVTERYMHNRGTNLERITSTIRLFPEASDPKVTPIAES